MFFSGNKHGPNPNIRSWNRCCKSSQSHWKYPELSSCTVSDMGYDCLGKNFSTDIKPNVTVIYTGENIFICYREKMQKGNSADSKLYILNQYEPAQDSVMVPDTFLLAESVLFLLKEKNDRIIWTKSALVFLHEPVRSHMSFRTRPGSVHQFKASLHFNPGCSLIGSHKTKNCVTSYMLWELYHGLRTMHTYTVHISCETQHQPAARGNSVRIWGRAVHYGEAPCVSRCVSIANLGQVLTSVASCFMCEREIRDKVEE